MRKVTAVLGDFMRKMNGRTRLLALAGAVAVMGLVAGVVLEAGGSRFSPLFTNLDPRDAADIVNKLEEQKVPYRLSAGGQTIEVPEPMVHKTRLLLVQDGLPRNGVVGLEIMDRTNLGATDFDRRVQYLRAIQGELTRTILEIDGVEKARVHLNVPEPSVFVRDRQPASASILLGLKPGVTLEPAQIKGIMHLVASSVEGLKPEAVTVLDENGQLLSADVSGERKGARPASSNLRLQEEFEKRMEENLRTLLEPIFGTGNVVARVNADLNLDEHTVERELFEPVKDGQGLLRSIQELEETFRGNGAPVAMGVPGTTSNTQIPTYPVVSGGAAGDSQYEKRNATRYFELNKTKEQVVVAPGAVKRLSVSVLVNRQLTPQQQEAVVRTVNAAVGFDPLRRDQVVVAGMSFDTSLADAVKRGLAPETQTSGKGKDRQLPVPYVVAGGAAAVSVLFFLFILLILRRRRRRHEEEELAAQIEALRAAGQMKKTPGAEQAASVSKEGVAPAKEEQGTGELPETAEAALIQSEVATLARQKPEEVAQIIRSWLHEN